MLMYLLEGTLLLVRTEALNHDIGKTYTTYYIIENQCNDINIYNNMNTFNSVQVIIDHVNKGAEEAKVYNIFQQMIDFIETHYGIKFAEFFYCKYGIKTLIRILM